MMKKTYEDPFLQVIDDFLTPCEWAAFTGAIKTVPLRCAVPGTAIWNGPEEEHPLESFHALVFPPRGSDALVAQCTQAAEARQLPMRFYPTHSDLDIAFGAIMEFVDSQETVVGTQGNEWVAVTASVYAYGAGTKASWHDDGRFYSGAFIFYSHESWERDWGGDFLFSSPSSNDDVGRVVFPRSNRLILVRSGAPHAVSRISSAAGTHIRMSLTGFFVKQHRAQELIAMVLSPN